MADTVLKIFYLCSLFIIPYPWSECLFQFIDKETESVIQICLFSIITKRKTVAYLHSKAFWHPVTFRLYLPGCIWPNISVPNCSVFEPRGSESWPRTLCPEACCNLPLHLTCRSMLQTWTSVWCEIWNLGDIEQLLRSVTVCLIW